MTDQLRFSYDKYKKRMLLTDPEEDTKENRWFPDVAKRSTFAAVAAFFLYQKLVLFYH